MVHLFQRNYQQQQHKFLQSGAGPPTLMSPPMLSLLRLLIHPYPTSSFSCCSAWLPGYRLVLSAFVVAQRKLNDDDRKKAGIEFWRETNLHLIPGIRDSIQTSLRFIHNTKSTTFRSLFSGRHTCKHGPSATQCRWFTATRLPTTQCYRPNPIINIVSGIK